MNVRGYNQHGNLVIALNCEETQCFLQDWKRQKLVKERFHNQGFASEFWLNPLDSCGSFILKKVINETN